MPSATDIRKGTVLVLDSELYVCTEFHHSTPGNKRGNVQTKLKNLRSGVTLSRKFSSTERVDFAFLDKRPCEYLYKDGNGYVFMDSESFEQDSGFTHRVMKLIRAEFEDHTWRAFWRSAVEGHSTAEIAGDLGMSKGAVRQAKYRVLQRLREELEDLQ